MSLRGRLRLVSVLGSLLLVMPFASGLGGFDPVMWIVFWAVFALWFLSVQAPGGEAPMPLAAALLAQGAVVAVLMGLGHLASPWSPTVLPAWLLIIVAVAALLIGRLLRVAPEDVAALIQGARAARQHGDAGPEPEPEPEPEAEPEAEPERSFDAVQAQAALIAMVERLDAEPALAPDFNALGATLGAAMSDAGPRSVADILFERAARSEAPDRERLALVALLCQPAVTPGLRGEGLAARVFDAIAAQDCDVSLARWARWADAQLGMAPGLAADFPAPDRIDRVADRYAIEDADLCESLGGLAARLRSGDGARG